MLCTTNTQVPTLNFKHPPSLIAPHHVTTQNIQKCIYFLIKPRKKKHFEFESQWSHFAYSFYFL